MRKITYKKLTVKNFLSIGNDAVVIEFQDGLNLITGKNIDNPERKNAIGKSSIVDAFYYALFGKTIRKIKLDFVVNNVTKGKGLVELEFDVETDTTIKSYRIVRQVKPSKVELWENGVDITKDSIKNESKFINNLIGNNEILYRSCDILSLRDNIPFMAKGPEDKKKFVEDIFSLEVFGKMLKELKEWIKTNKFEMGISSAKIEEINKSLELLEKQKEAYRVQIEERDKVLEGRRLHIEDQIRNTEYNIATYTISDLDRLVSNKRKLDYASSNLEDKIRSIELELSQIKTKSSLKQKEIDKASSVEGATCDKCLQDIPHSHIAHLEGVKFQLMEDLGELQGSEKTLRDQKAAFTNKLSPVKSKSLQIQQDIEKAKTDQIKLEALEDKLSRFRESLANLVEDSEQQDAPIFEDSIKDTQERLDTESEILEGLKQAADDYNTCKFILGEEGVKSFVVKRLLGMLNASIQQYITDLGMSIRCKFDEYFDEKITDDKGVELSYWNLSGGERTTIDFSCAWAFKDLKRKISGVSSNVEWLDEILDATLDEHGMDLLIQVIKSRIEKSQLSCYAISHRKETLKHIDGEIVMLEKENRITTRIQTVD